MSNNSIDKAVTLKQFIGGGITLLIAISGTFINSLITLREIEIRVEALEKTVTTLSQINSKIEVLIEKTESITKNQDNIFRQQEKLSNDIFDLYKNK